MQRHDDRGSRSAGGRTGRLGRSLRRSCGLGLSVLFAVLIVAGCECGDYEEDAPWIGIVTHPSDCTVTEGDVAAFTVAAESDCHLSYQWYRDGMAMPGAEHSSYVMPTATLADDGALFVCAVGNYDGTAISNAAMLTVNMAPPVITTSPSDQAVWKGQNATFTVAAASSGPMTYQWQEYVDGVWRDISGATGPSCTILETVPADDGRRFRCEVTNAAGSATSDAATLAVGVGAGFAKARGGLGSPLRERGSDGSRPGDPLARRGDASLLL